MSWDYYNSFNTSALNYGSPSFGQTQFGTSWPAMQDAGLLDKNPFAANSSSGGGMGLGPWMALSAGLNFLGGMQQSRAMAKASAATNAANLQMAGIAAATQRAIGKANVAQGIGARSAQYGWGADLDFDRQKQASIWDKTIGADLDLAADYKRKKQGFALLTDRNYKASQRRQREHEIRKEKARQQAAMAGMFGPISGGFT